VACPPGDIRPSMDRMRISLFSILGDLSGAAFLDLYSGSGVLGIEAASRGAEPVVLVEMDRGKRQAILKNISFVTSRIELVSMNVERFLRGDSRRFDIVILDPPFNLAGKAAVLDMIAEGGHLAADGLAILHLHRSEAMEIRSPAFELADRREYGQSILLFFRPRA
jgi:16S rRNA (guanine966-N2)-methyltransferase